MYSGNDSNVFIKILIDFHAFETHKKGQEDP